MGTLQQALILARFVTIWTGRSRCDAFGATAARNQKRILYKACGACTLSGVSTARTFCKLPMKSGCAASLSLLLLGLAVSPLASPSIWLM